MLVGKMERASPLDRAEHLNFFDEVAPISFRQAVQFLGCPAEDLGQLKYGEGSLIGAGRFNDIAAALQRISEAAQGSGKASCLARDVGKRKPIQEQPHPQELHEAALRNGMD